MLVAGRDGPPCGLLAGLVLMQRLPDRVPLRDREGERHRAADQDRVGRARELLDHADLVGDLDAARDHHEGVLGCPEQAAEHVELALQEQPGGGGKQVRDALGRGVRTMRRTERVVDVEVTELCELGREGEVVLLLTRVVAHVLAQQHVAVGELPRLRDNRLADAIVGPADRRAEQLLEAHAHGRERGGGIARSLRTAEVRAEHDPRVALAQRTDRRQRGTDARVVADHAVRERDVEVDPAEHPTASDLELIDPAQRHRTFVTRSTRRFEKPHSLSYQLTTLAVRPCTIVSCASKIDEYGEPTMSAETIGSSVYSRMPVSRP